MCEACKPPGIGVAGRAAGRRAQREHDAKVAADAVRAYAKRGTAPQSRPTPTDYAQRVLMVVGGIVLLASMNFLLHALLYSLAAVFAMVSAAAVVVTVRRRRRLRTVIPAPLPASRPRTVVTAVTVQPLEAPRKAALAAGYLERGKARRP